MPRADEAPHGHEDDHVPEGVVDEPLSEDRDQGRCHPGDDGAVAAIAAAFGALSRPSRGKAERRGHRDDDQHGWDSRLGAPREPEVVRVQRVDRARLGAGAEARDWKVAGAVPDPRLRLDLAEGLGVDLLSVVVGAGEGDRAHPLRDHLDLRVSRRERSDQPRDHDHRETERHGDDAGLAQGEEQIDERENRADPGTTRKREGETREQKEESRRRQDAPEARAGSEGHPDGDERPEIAEGAELVRRAELAREPVVHGRRPGDRLELAEVRERPADEHD